MVGLAILAASCGAAAQGALAAPAQAEAAAAQSDGSASSAAPARAAAEPGVSPAVVALLRKALHRYGAISVLRTEPGPAAMTAALVAVGPQKAIVWIVGGQAVVVGDVWDAQGHDLTHAMAIRMGLLPRPLAPAAVAQAVAHSKTFVLGSKGPEVTVFMDPNCIFCHRLYEQAVPLLAQGRLRLRVVLVGFLKPSSLGRAAAILMAPDPQRALASDEQGFNVTTEEGGIAPPSNIPARMRAAVDANTKLLAASGAVATPTLLFRNQAGDWQIMHHGPPGGLAAWLAQQGSERG